MVRLRNLKNDWIPILAPSLPLPDAIQDDESVGYRIRFKPLGLGRVKAVVYSDVGMRIDEVVQHCFEEAHRIAAESYPQAKWDNPHHEGA